MDLFLSEKKLETGISFKLKLNLSIKIQSIKSKV